MPNEISRRLNIIVVLPGLHYTLRDYGPPSVPHKTSESEIPVPDPGVPALPEMTTSPSSPSISRASFHQQVYMYHRINATHKIKTTRRQRRNTGYEYDNFVSDQVLQDAPVAAGTPRENQ
ncbi:hypothetical protein ACLKA6_007580 [Drosophila palustris]